MFKTATDIVLFIGGVFVIIGGFYKAYVEFYKKRKELRKKMDTFFSAAWTNEGALGVEFPTHFIDLRLSCSGKKIRGSFDVRKIDEDHTWHSLSIFGKRRFSTLRCNIIHARDGKVLDYGKFILKKSPDENLKWRLEEGVADFFPLETTLFRLLPTII